MRAVVCQHAELTVEALPEPVPAPGQARIEVTRAGICGSDLHARHGVDSWAEIADSVGYHRFARSTEPVVFGHEYVGTVAEYGPRDAGETVAARDAGGGGAADPQRRARRLDRPVRSHAPGRLR